MMLRPRVAVTSLLIAVPVAALVTYGVERVRTREREVTIEGILRSQVNDQIRERCESDPNWFLTGPLEGRPPKGIFVERFPDEVPPRPKLTQEPYELFVYDDAFLGTSSAAPRFPQEFRFALQRTAVPVVAPYVTPQGTGVQAALTTGWVNGPCMFLLARMAPPPHQLTERLRMAAAVFAVSFVALLLALSQTVFRVLRLARDARQSVANDYTAIAPDRHRDELSSLTFVFNDVSTALKERRNRIEDQDAALKRFVRMNEEEIARPLEALTKRLGTVEIGAATDARAELRGALREAHDLTSKLENLTAAARLKLTTGPLPAGPVDLRAVVDEVADRHRAIAQAAGVSLEIVTPHEAVTIDGDRSLLASAIANVVDNAIRYNRPGGRVKVVLARANDPRGFELRVTDDGPGVSDEVFRGLTAIHRFRGDEGRNRRPGSMGLGLAVAREVADRSGLQLDLQRPDVGGFEAVLQRRT